LQVMKYFSFSVGKKTMCVIALFVFVRLDSACLRFSEMSQNGWWVGCAF
jgi:hypothetical protein